VMGWIDADGAGGHVGSYKLTSSSVARVTPDNPSLPLRNASVERSGGGTSGGSTVIRFVAAVADVGAEWFDGSVSSNVGWALCSSHGKVFHDAGRGSVKIDFGTENKTVAQSTAADTQSAGADNFPNHGAAVQGDPKLRCPARAAAHTC